MAELASVLEAVATAMGPTSIIPANRAEEPSLKDENRNAVAGNRINGTPNENAASDKTIHSSCSGAADVAGALAALKQLAVARQEERREVELK